MTDNDIVQRAQSIGGRYDLHVTVNTLLIYDIIYIYIYIIYIYIYIQVPSL